MKKLVYTAPALELVQLSCEDVMEASEGETYGMALDMFDFTISGDL